MARLPVDLLERSPEESARLLALGFLREAEAAFQRVEQGTDPEALHDFRVAIRRLRSSVRAYRPWLKTSIGPRMRRRLRALTEATNAGRDAEALLAWVQAQGPAVGTAGQEGVTWLAARLTARRDEAQSTIVADVKEQFRAVAATLRRRLAEFETTVRLSGRTRHPPFGRVTGELLGAHVADLRARLAAVPGRDGTGEIHRARISAKRLRYLLEPLARRSKAAAAAVGRLKELQTLSGDLRDAEVLSQEIMQAVEDVAAARARRLHGLALSGEAGTAERMEAARDESPGLVLLARAARESGDELFARLESDWLGGHADPFLEKVDGFARSLARRRKGRVEIERKFLLRELPERLRGQPAALVTQGWLPGTDLHERVRRSRGPGGEAYSRTLKFGNGVVRTEIEEETSREVFDALWPLTDGCRVEKRRYEVREGDRVWEVDEFADRDLVLAEVELESEHSDVEVPGWLKPYVVREVTDEPEYVNLNLAR